ncbi:Histone H2A.Z-specific chaperone [Lachnellula subtilissima]|uniref:Histone H2A.Z-specific chaperone n=1 Tax=Lachnellula subtilissima TaxID=602034 RepID=A0A8H8S5D1_9HELO|nr:Histone H2A.Z-specific chaperone [Lachnellula subtilissima]
MADKNGSATLQENGGAANPTSDAKGKGKAAEPETREVNMEGEDSSSEEEVDDNEPVVDEPDDDNMEEIDTENIISDGRRTRGRKIDFAKAAEEDPEEDEESEDDGDFEAPDDEMEE